MSWMNKMERRFGSWAIPNLILGILAIQLLFYVGVYILNMDGFLEFIALDPAMVLRGQVWRLVTFIFIPPSGSNMFFAFFAFYFYYMIGSSLESQWGHFRFNLFISMSMFFTVVLAFLPPFGAGLGFTNIYIMTSMFFAFAMLFPDIEFLVFFILPVKVKYLAMISFLFYCYYLVVGDMDQKKAIVAVFITLGIFFHREIKSIYRGLTRKQRLKVYNTPPPPPAPRPQGAYGTQAPRQAPHPAAPQPLTAFHRCESCGATEQTHPAQDFRYCPECDGLVAYCSDHIRNHIHKRNH